jgi:sensor domain CHASE-containing protein
VKIHTRTLLILGVTVFVLIFGMNVLAQYFILSSHAEIEQGTALTDVRRVLDQIEHEQLGLANSASDWAVWDGSYQYIQDRQETFYRSTIDPASTYECLQINGLFYYDASGNQVAGTWYDLQNKTPAEVPPDLLAFFTNNPHLILNSTGSGRSGFVLLSQGPVQISLHSILPSSGSGSGNGTLIMVRSFDKSRVAALKNMSNLPIRLTVISGPDAQMDPILNKISNTELAEEGTIIQNDTTITGYSLIRDINNEPILLLEVDSPRLLYQQAMNALTFLIFGFIIIGIIYVIVTEFLLRRYIVTPLMGLDASMKEIGRSCNLSKRLSVSGDDEVASLRKSLNTMLGELQDKEAELARKRDQLAEANRQANLYLDIYLDVLTYEIRNSTLSIHGYADLIRSSDGEDERMFADRIIETIHRETEVIQTIETISRIFKNPPAQEPVDLDSVIQTAIKSYPTTSIQYEPSGITVLADPMISAVFDNTIANSIKFGGQDVQITISCQDAGDDTIECSVTDTGPGIPDEQKPGVFDRFMQGSEKRSSYGLGLHIAKMLIEAYGGRIRADDRVAGEPGKGAAIRFTLKKVRTGR